MKPLIVVNTNTWLWLVTADLVCTGGSWRLSRLGPELSVRLQQQLQSRPRHAEHHPGAYPEICRQSEHWRQLHLRIRGIIIIIICLPNTMCVNQWSGQSWWYPYLYLTLGSWLQGPVYLDIPLQLESGVNWSVFASDFDNNNMYRWANLRHVTRDLLAFRHTSVLSTISSVPQYLCRIMQRVTRSFPASYNLTDCSFVFDVRIVSSLHNVNVAGSGRNLQAWDKIRGWESQGWARHEY